MTEEALTTEELRPCDREWRRVRVKWAGYHLHGKTVNGRRCKQFGEDAWEVEYNGLAYVIPYNRAAVVGPAWFAEEKK